MYKYTCFIFKKIKPLEIQFFYIFVGFDMKML